MSLKGKSSYCREQVLFGAPCEQRTEPNSSSLACSEGSRGSMYQSKLTVMASNRLCKVESMLWRAPTAQPSWDLCRPQLGTRILTVMVLCLSVLFLKPDMHLSRYWVCSVIAPNSEVIFVWFTFHFWTGEHQLVKAFIWKQSLSALPLFSHDELWSNLPRAFLRAASDSGLIQLWEQTLSDDTWKTSANITNQTPHVSSCAPASYIAPQLLLSFSMSFQKRHRVDSNPVQWRTNCRAEKAPPGVNFPYIYIYTVYFADVCLQ